MGILSAIQSIFSPLPEGSVRYKGYIIEAKAEPDGRCVRMSAVITKNDQTRNLFLIDRLASESEGVRLTHQKMKKYIDQRGDEIFI